MRLYQQLILFMLAATVLPLALVGFWLLRGAEQELAHRISSEQRGRAEAAAKGISQALLGAVELIAQAAEMFDWERTSKAEVDGGLRLLYQQSPFVSAVVMVDREGRVIAGPMAGLEGASAFQGEGVATLAKAIDVKPLSGNRGEAALSKAYLDSFQERAAVAVAVGLSSGDRSSFALAELGMAQVAADLVAHSGAEIGRIELVDIEGRVVASSHPATALAPLPVPLWTSIQHHLAAQPSASFSVESGGRLLVSAARVPGQLGMIAVVSVDERTALDSVRRMRQTVLVSIGAALVVLLLLGAAFTRRLNRRLGQVVEGAEAFAKGELGKRIPVTGGDELTDLSETFNRMGAELEAARTRLERWNDDLRQKVDEATADLRAAQVQLLETQKLAAVGQLGAGVAHEINNPLAGILGNAQLLLLERDDKDSDFEMLRKIEQSAKRCKEITQNLLRFSQQREKAELRPTDLNAVVRDAFSLVTHQTKSEGVQLVSSLHPDTVMVRGDSGHLSQVLLAMLSNARTAMRSSLVKELKVTTRIEDGQAVVEVRDTGKGIKPEHLPHIFEPFFTTKDVWSNVGLGLSVAYRVISEHHGKIEVASEVGKGTTFTVRVPRLVS